eukprot:m.1338053 g.1338053  ORF g.1338053 m.1338053 type:complete len:73 (-) comp24883_c1_seq9:238-456(-)
MHTFDSGIGEIKPPPCPFTHPSRNTEKTVHPMEESKTTPPFLWCDIKNKHNFRHLNLVLRSPLQPSLAGHLQ